MTDTTSGLAVADWLLALIPVALLAGVLAGVTTSLSLAAGTGAGAVPASGLVGYALFRAPLEN